jgi:hypothetical protein
MKRVGREAADVALELGPVSGTIGSSGSPSLSEAPSLVIDIELGGRESTSEAKDAGEPAREDRYIETRLLALE